MRAQRREVVLVQVGPQAERLGERGEPFQDAALVAGDARDLHERGRVGSQRPCVDHGAASSVASSASSAACECIRRTALVSARV